MNTFPPFINDFLQQLTYDYVNAQGQIFKIPLLDIYRNFNRSCIRSECSKVECSGESIIAFFKTQVKKFCRESLHKDKFYIRVFFDKQEIQYSHKYKLNYLNFWRVTVLESLGNVNQIAKLDFFRQYYNKETDMAYLGMFLDCNLRLKGEILVAMKVDRTRVE